MTLNIKSALITMKKPISLQNWILTLLLILSMPGIALSSNNSTSSEVIFFNDFKNVRLGISVFNDHNLIEWVIDGELTSSVSIILERAVNNKEFKPIASFYDVRTNYFQFKDYIKTEPGDYFYRISVQNNDIEVNLSSVASIELRENHFYKPAEFDLNPFHHTLHINFIGADGQIEEIHFYNAFGERIFSKKTCHLDSHSFTFPNITWPGNYTAVLESKQWRSKTFEFDKEF